MEITSIDGQMAMCAGSGRQQMVDLMLIDDAKVGSHILVYLGSAIRVLEEAEARQITDALQAVELAQRGADFDHLLADLIDREPTLPPHLVQQSTKEETKRTWESCDDTSTSGDAG